MSDTSMTRPAGDRGEVTEHPPAPRRTRRWQLSAQTVTSLVSSGSFFVLVMVVALAPVPYVSWSPGRTVNLAGQSDQGQPIVQVEGLPTYPLNGELRMTTVSVTRVDSHLGLLQALWSHAMPARDVLPRGLVYPPGKSATQVKAEEIRMMGDSQADAMVAALRAAGQPVAELPMVTAVNLSGPALNKLQPGDLVAKVDGKAVQSVQDVDNAIRLHKVGTPAVFTVERAGKQQTITVTTVAATNNPQQPAVGVEWGVGYRYEPSVAYGINSKIVGPSAGVLFSLAIYDLITQDDLLDGRKIAGTGAISPEGTIGPIGGIQQKIRGAEKAGATIFLVPAANCQDLRGVGTNLELVKVATLREAITGLQKLKSSPEGNGVPRC